MSKEYTSASTVKCRSHKNCEIQVNQECAKCGQRYRFEFHGRSLHDDFTPVCDGGCVNAMRYHSAVQRGKVRA